VSSTLPPLVDRDGLRDFLNERLPGGGELRIQRHRAGHSNETFFVTRDDQEWVLRRPPRGAFLPSAHDVSREYRVLSALSSSRVRSPRTILACDDESVIGAPFYLMERVRGVVIRRDLPDWMEEGDRAALGDELVDALTELHEVDYKAVGLEGFGKPDGYLDRQLRRWSGQLELTLPHTRPLPELERVGEWLRDNVPASPPSTIVHGDYKLDNVMYGSQSPVSLRAILDWEMATLGDPLADLGWMVSFWIEPGEAIAEPLQDFSRVTALPGFRSRGELVRRYVQTTGRDASALDWYRVLAVYKLAVLLEGSYARHLSGVTDDPFFATLEHGVPALAGSALELAGR
jgi:aminoglycoside phosphotransferase (APT) family kinase protein